MFRSMVFSALGVALVVGLFLSAVQTLAVSPIIHAAEVFEIAQPEVVTTHNDGHSHSHDETHGVLRMVLSGLLLLCYPMCCLRLALRSSY